MAVNRPIVIEIWKGDWGLPSIDLNCLKILALVKFSGTDYELKITNNPFKTPKGSLPVVTHGSYTYCDYDEVLSYLKIKNVNPDHGLSTMEISECVAYRNMLQEKLFPALQYVWWIDEKNHTGLTRPWYCKALPFPLNFYYPQKYLKEANSLMDALYGIEIETKSDLETKIHNEAEKCITALSVRLGENDFMFGSHPTSLDAVVFAFLAPLLKAPFKNTVLQNHLKACINLRNYVSKICERYFSKDYQEFETKRKQEPQSKTQTESDLDYPHKTRNTVFAALFAIAAMFGYAFSIGMVQTPSIEDKFKNDIYYSTENYDEDN